MQNYNLPTHTTTNTFNGVIFILPSESEYDLTGASIKIDFKSARTSNEVKLRMSTANSKMSITLPYTFKISEQKINLSPGTYYWDCKITFSDGREKTYIGGSWNIIDIITK